MEIISMPPQSSGKQYGRRCEEALHNTPQQGVVEKHEKNYSDPYSLYLKRKHALPILAEIHTSAQKALYHDRRYGPIASLYIRNATSSRVAFTIYAIFINQCSVFITIAVHESREYPEYSLFKIFIP